MRNMHVRMAENGRVVIPAELREELGLRGGTIFVLEVEDGAIKLVPFERVLDHIRAEVRRYVPEGVSLSDELIAERRREAELE